METLWIIVGVLFILAGIIGAFLPVVPGLPFSYGGLLMLQLTSEPPFSVMYMVYWALIVVVVMSLENIIPAAGVKRFGGSVRGIIGCIAGAVLGIFLFPPYGIVIGPVVGAFAGELLDGKDSQQALRAAMGSFLGFFVGTVIKVVTALIIAYIFFSHI